MTTITVLPAKNNSKTRRYHKQGLFLAKKRAEKIIASRTIENTIDSIFTIKKTKHSTIYFKPTQYYPSENNCCLPNSAIFAGIKIKSLKRTFGVTAK